MTDIDHGARIEEGLKRVRTYLGGRLVADTVRPKLVWELTPYPAYYLPRDDVRMELLEPTGRTHVSPGLGQASYFTVRAGDREVEDAAWHYPESPHETLRGLIRFGWDAMDAWFEEDEEVYVHPRSPYTRLDILDSSRHVVVVLNDLTVADSRRPRLLFETGLPTRYYLPRLDVRMDVLRPSPTTTQCPYKGTAEYWSVEAGGQVFQDVVWTYRSPAAESTKVAGLACFLNERVDLYVDGALQERPRTPFS